MTTTQQLLGLVVAALTNATDAGPRVFSPRDWPTRDDEFPVIQAQAIHERKESLGRGAVEFNVVATIRLTARVTAPAQVADGGASVVESAALTLARQMEVAVINNNSIMLDGNSGNRLSQYPFVDTRISVSAAGKQHDAEIVMDVGLEFYQGPEDFAQPATSSLTNIQINTDLVNVFDTSGTYTPNFSYPVTPAPRTSGPDGRDEGAGLNITLPGG